jgi:nucleoside-diphosphate-sugar epimerase
VTLLDLVNKLNGILGKDIEPVFAPPRAGDILHSRANIGKAQDLLDFAPVVSFDDGLARTVGWYQQQ